MKISLILLGKTQLDYIDEGIKIYFDRIQHYIPFEITIIKSVKKYGSNDIQQIKTAEGNEILKKLKPGDYVVLLDEKGKGISSSEFAIFIENKLASGVKNMIFIIGGAYGFSDNIYLKANEKISLSKMTFSHQLARLIFVEQLYRAFTIIKGENYHHE